jgi:hypothetical protein
MKTRLSRVLTAILLLSAPLARAQVVTTTNSTGAGSLRAVVASAATNATITFPAGLSGQTISLGSSQILLNKNVTIDASALPLGIQITQPPFQAESTPLARMFQVASNVTVSLKALTLWGGSGDGSVLGGGDHKLRQFEPDRLHSIQQSCLYWRGHRERRHADN